MNPISRVSTQSWTAVFVFVLGACSARPGTLVLAKTPHAQVNDAWTTMSWEERHDTMTFEVLPTMAPMFQRFEGASAPRMTCLTCHGADAEKVGYAMPRGLPPLDPRNMPRADSSNPKEARIVKFMTDEVTPAMVEILGVRPLRAEDADGIWMLWMPHDEGEGIVSDTLLSRRQLVLRFLLSGERDIDEFKMKGRQRFVWPQH